LSVLGGNGLTAYFGLHEIGQPKEGETVVVSAAAGGVGSIAGQLARLEGCRAVGVVGSDEKCRFIVEELGYDAAINRKSGNLAQQLRQACPDGVDIYFDNVGGEVLNTTLRHINIGARIVLCGAISQINEKTLPPGPSNYVQLLAKRARMEGFVTLDFARQWQEASEELANLVADGSLVVPEEIVEGIDQIPEAFQRLFTGEKLGKLTIKV
jgi:NADPH-dependent curcumin reductase CurA